MSLADQKDIYKLGLSDYTPLVGVEKAVFP